MFSGVILTLAPSIFNMSHLFPKYYYLSSLPIKKVPFLLKKLSMAASPRHFLAMGKGFVSRLVLAVFRSFGPQVTGAILDRHVC